MTSKVNVTVSGSVSRSWLWIDAAPLAVIDGHGAVELEPGRHLLTWVMAGERGETLSVTLSRGMRTLVPRRARMPATKPMGFGGVYFDV